MKLGEIYQPITTELHLVEAKLKNIGEDMEIPSVKEVFKYFFEYPGKLLRPALVLLSAGTVNPEQMGNIRDQLVQLGVSIELVHSASLVHDDIIDEDLMRRGQQTLNNAYDNKLAAWVGDALYARAFSILSNLFPKDFAQVMLQVTKRMSMVEMQQAIRDYAVPVREDYLKLIKGKTATLMGAACRLGAALAVTDESAIANLEVFGINFGMTYQVIDDYIDKDPLAEGNVNLEEAFQYAANAKHAIDSFKHSVYKDSLVSMVDYILSHTSQ